MNLFRYRHAISCAALSLTLALTATAGQRHESFDRDPGWEGQNNRSSMRMRIATQDFGYSPETNYIGGEQGEIGGSIQGAGEPAWYAKAIGPFTLDDGLTASGKMRLSRRLSDGHFQLGFFNSKTAQGWRTPNTINFRFAVRGKEDNLPVFFAFTDYLTSKWRAAGLAIGGINPKTGRESPIHFSTGEKVHTWSLRYDPKGGDGHGAVTGTMDGESVTIELEAAHRADGATFDRFGLLNAMKSNQGATPVWIDDVMINGVAEDFSKDPGWEGRGNRRIYQDHLVRPRFDFGYSPTKYAGGAKSGELGGLVWRGDCQYPDEMASYGDRVGTLTLEQPLKASGKISLRKGITDSSAMIGFYHSVDSMFSNPSQVSGNPNGFIGAVIEGPSSEGFYFFPAYRFQGGAESRGRGNNPPHIYPDASTHDWSVEYDPAAADGNGRLTTTLDGHSVTMDLPPGTKAAGGQFNRFGIVTTWIDGNGQYVYFDDLEYTVGRED